MHAFSEAGGSTVLFFIHLSVPTGVSTCWEILPHLCSKHADHHADQNRNSFIHIHQQYLSQQSILKKKLGQAGTAAHCSLAILALGRLRQEKKTL